MGLTDGEDRSTGSTAIGQALRKRRLQATLMLALLTMFWGMTFPATKAALENTDPIHFLALRFTLGFVLLYPLWRFGLRRQRRTRRDAPPPEKPSDPEVGLLTARGIPHPLWRRLRTGALRSVWLRGVIVGLFLGAGFMLQVYGMHYTTASRSGFFTGLLVILVPPVATLLRTSVSPLASWLALPPAAFGIYLLADPSLGGLNTGDLLTIGCAVCFALQMVVLEALTESESDTHIFTLAQVGTVAILAVAVTLAQGQPIQLSRAGLVALGYTALFGTVVAVWMQTRYQPVVPAGHAALVFTLEPVFAATFAWILLGDSWTPRGLSGALLIVSAMLLSSGGLSLRRRGQTAQV